MTSAALAAALGIHPQTVLEWVREGLLPRGAGKGPATRYGPEHLRLGRAIAKAGPEVARLPRFAEMVRLILDEPAPPAAPATPPAEALVPGTAWTRAELVPGVELHVRADVPPAIRVLARDVAARFGAKL